ncbi:MAG TPA: hypothetical protein VN958_04130, partial [Chitinophagaceae bacterium]|nr:hypothetical protein [Chitinophagaceae bacterium]
VIFFLAGCQKNINDKKRVSNEVNSTTVTNSTSPPFNLEVILSGEGNEFGLVKFRQDNDTARIITLDTWVRDLEPNHSYLLQRAVDPIINGNCLSTAWLTLGKGLQPQAITTDATGTGREELWRDVTTIPRGTSFYIHFQVIDAVSLAVVLTSDCYQYTVR